MKTRSKVFFKTILCVLTAVLTLIISSPVVTATSTTLTTTVPVTFPLKLELSGNGTVTINGVAYTQSQTIEIPRNIEIELHIEPNEGSEIATVTYKNFDYTKEAINGNFTLPAIAGESTLRIHFTEITSSPTTGDPYSPLFFVLIMLLSLMGIIVASTFMNKKEK